jgi:phage terminase large subunit-like protein
MTLLLADPPAWSSPPEQGIQYPRIFTHPPYVATWGPRAFELAAKANLHLDEWQQHDVSAAMGVKADGDWAASDVGIVVSRQNGKGSELECRQLAGLYLIEGERVQIHTAHLAETSLEAFNRLAARIEDTPELSKRLRRNGIHRANGKEGITLKDGKRIKFRTRTSGGARGLTGDVVYFDEAMIISEATMTAVSFVLAARPNTQTWFTGSAVDQTVHKLGVPFARVRERGLRGDPELVYCEYSLDADLAKITEETAMDPHSWARANPGYRIRISDRAILSERGKNTLRGFCVERLGVGDWPATDDEATRIVDMTIWASIADPDSVIVGPVSYALDTTPDRAFSAISAAGRRNDDVAHVEIIEHGRGTGWLVSRAAELVAAHNAQGIIIDPSSPAGSLMTDLEKAGVKVFPVTAQEHAQACGIFYDSVMDGEPRLRHLGSPALTSALAGAVKTPVGDAWKWDRKNSSVDISPLVAATLALWGVETQPSAPEVHDLNEAVERLRRERGLPESGPKSPVPVSPGVEFIPF